MKSKKCYKCGNSVPDGAGFCSNCGAPQTIDNPKKNHLVRNIIIILALLFVVAAAIIGSLLAYKSYRINTLMDLGYNYLFEEDYESALIAFEEVIQIDDKQVDAYVGAADAYIGMGDYEAAARILQEGYENTGDNYLQIKFDITEEILQSIENSTEEKLSQMVMDVEPNGYIGWSIYDDFNKDGVSEYFAIVADSPDEFDGEYGPCGRVWFANSNGAICIVENDFEGFDPKIWETSEGKMICLEEYYGGSGSISHAWIVKDGEVKKMEYTASGLNYHGDDQFTINPSDYDSFVDEDGVSAGHTWKTYFLYYKDGEFREYGGVEISEDDLARLDGGYEAVNEVKKYGTIKGIYYRSNDMVQISYTTEYAHGIDNNYSNYKIEGNRVFPYNIYESKEVTTEEGGEYTYGGIIYDCYYPEIAEYPERFPY